MITLPFKKGHGSSILEPSSFARLVDSAVERESFFLLLLILVPFSVILIKHIDVANVAEGVFRKGWVAIQSETRRGLPMCVLHVHGLVTLIYVQGPAVAMVHTKVRSIFRLPNVFLKIVE